MSARPARRKLFIVVYYSVFVVIIFYRSFYCFFGKHRTVHFVSGKSVKRFGNTSSSHATLIAAESGGIYALSVQGSGLVYGTEKPEEAPLVYALVTKDGVERY